MSYRRRSLVAIGLALLVLWSNTNSRGQIAISEQAPTIEQIRKVWQARQKKVSGARLDFEIEVTIPKDSVNERAKQLRLATKRALPTDINPPNDISVNATGGLSISKSKVRYWYKTQDWDPNKKQLVPLNNIDVFDETDRRVLQLYGTDAFDGASKLATNNPVGLIKKADRPDIASNLGVAALMYIFRGDDPKFDRPLGNLTQVSDGLIKVGKRECILVSHAEPSKSTEVLFLDRDREYVVVRHARLFDGKPKWQLDIDYQPDTLIGWMPKSWEYTIRVSSGAPIVEAKRYTVTKYELNPVITDDEFQLTFPIGTSVVDTAPKRPVQYVVTKEGEQPRKFDLNDPISYQEMLSRPSKITSISISVSLAVLLIGAIGLWITRKRRLARRPSTRSKA